MKNIPCSCRMIMLMEWSAFTKKQIMRGERSWWYRTRWFLKPHTPPSLNICKIYICMRKKFSLKANWSWRKTFIQLSHKEDPHSLGRKVISSNQVIQASPWERTQLRRGLQQRIFLGSKVIPNTYLGTPAWDSMTGSCVPLLVWKLSECKQEFLKLQYKSKNITYLTGTRLRRQTRNFQGHS